MKIKEKGLKGKAADNRKQMLGRKFNAFRDMAKTQDGKGEPEVYLEFMGTKLLIHKDKSGHGFVKKEDVPFVKGATLRFDGCGGSVTFSELKLPLKEKFDGHAPFIEYNRGDDHGFIGFHQVLSEADIELVKETVKTINSKEVTWSLAPGTFRFVLFSVTIM